MTGPDTYVIPYVPGDETFIPLDRNASPFDVLTMVSSLLKPFGMAVMISDGGEEPYLFKIIRRPGAIRERTDR